MKLPRNISGKGLLKLLGSYGYEISWQTGSHMICTTNRLGEHRISIPAQKSLKAGTLNAILKKVADHLQISKEELLNDLFR